MGDLFEQVPGKWIAVRDDEIVEARDTFDQVIAALIERNIKDAVVLRAPDPADPELVGFG